MIVLSYGMTKSGSTLAFELCKAVLERRGNVQRRLPDDVVMEGHHINFLSDVTRASLEKLLAEVTEAEIVAIKIHAPIGLAEVKFIEQGVADGRIKVQVNFRDPREVSLSLMDAGARAREKGNKAFAEIHTLLDAAKVARRQLAACRRWGSIRGALHLFYNDVAFDTRATADRFCADFGLQPLDDIDFAAVSAVVFGEAFTQKNKAVKDRYKDDLTIRQNEFLLEEIKGASGFIRRVCEQGDYSWFQLERET